MTPEVAILKGFLDRKVYDTYRTFLDPDFFDLREHKVILEEIDKAYESDAVLTVADITTLVAIRAPNDDGMQAVLDQFNEVISENTLEQVLVVTKERSLATKLATKALDVADGRGSFDDLVEFVEQNRNTNVVSTDDINILSMDITTYGAETDEDKGLNWRLECLRKSLGPIRRGNLGHIFAVPETGKTALWVSEVTHMVQQTDKTIVVFFNEEAGKEVIFRMYSSMLAIPYKDILRDPSKYRDQFMDFGGDRIIFVDEAPLRIPRIERVMAKYEPALCIIDNADKVQVKSQDRRDLEIHNVYKWARELAKQYCPVITVAHADANGYDRKYLDESMMANSKVGKPAEMDYIIGIGRIEENMKDMRYINIPKNKLRGDDQTEEVLRHGRFGVRIEPELSRFYDV